MDIASVFKTMSSKHQNYVIKTCWGTNCTHCTSLSLELNYRVKNKVIQGHNVKKVTITFVANFVYGGFYKPSSQLLHLHCLVYLCATISHAGL